MSEQTILPTYEWSIYVANLIYIFYKMNCTENIIENLASIHGDFQL